MTEIEEVPVSHPPGKTPQCESLACPNAAVFCRVKVKSLPPKFQQIMKTAECLSEDLKVLKSAQSVVNSKNPGEYLEKAETNPVSYSSSDSVKLGDFFANP